MRRFRLFTSEDCRFVLERIALKIRLSGKSMLSRRELTDILNEFLPLFFDGICAADVIGDFLINSLIKTVGDRYTLNLESRVIDFFCADILIRNNVPEYITPNGEEYILGNISRLASVAAEAVYLDTNATLGHRLLKALCSKSVTEAGERELGFEIINNMRVRISNDEMKSFVRLVFRKPVIDDLYKIHEFGFEKMRYEQMCGAVAEFITQSYNRRSADYTLAAAYIHLLTYEGQGMRLAERRMFTLITSDDEWDEYMYLSVLSLTAFFRIHNAGDLLVDSPFVDMKTDYFQKKLRLLIQNSKFHEMVSRAIIYLIVSKYYTFRDFGFTTEELSGLIKETESPVYETLLAASQGGEKWETLCERYL